MPKGYFTNRALWLQRKREASFRLRKPIDIKLLKKRYLVDKISTYALQKEFGLTNNILRQRLVEAGVKLRSYREAQALIPHEFPFKIEKVGYKKWYSITQSPKARKKRAISHTGKKFSEDRKRHIREGIGRGRKNKLYLGEKAGYKAKHCWFNFNGFKMGVCSYCGKKGVSTKRNKTGTHWSNLDWEYNRENKKSWTELCPSCNHSYDKAYPFRVKLLKKLGLLTEIKIPQAGQKNPYTGRY